MEDKKFKSKPEWKKLINEGLNYEEFQELCKDLAKKNGFYNLNYRGGGPDGGRDLEGEFRFPLGKKEKQEKCWFQAKKQDSSVNFKQIVAEVVDAQNKGVKRYILMSNSDTTPSCKDSIERWNKENKCQIEDWTGSEFIDLLWTEPDICGVYFPDEETPPLANMLVPKKVIDLSEDLGDRFGIEIRINKEGINPNNSGDVARVVKEALFNLKIDLNLKSLIYEKVSMFFFSIGKTDDAIAFLNKSLDITPRNTNALLTKGYILEKLDLLDESNKVYDEIFEIEDNNVLALNNKSFNLLRQGNLEEALVLINRALELNPKLIMAIKNKIKILKALKKSEEALEILSQNEEAFEKSTELLLEKIYICIDRLDLKEAFKVNEEVLQKEPNNIDSLNNRGVIYERNARYQLGKKYNGLALKTFEDVIKKDKDYSLGWANKAAILINNLQINEAEKIIDLTYSIFPDSVEVINKKGILLLTKNEPKKATKYFDSALKKFYRGEFLLNRATAKLNLNHYLEALKDTERLLKNEPKNSKAWAIKGQCLRRLRQPFWREAFENADKFQEKPISLLED